MTHFGDILKNFLAREDFQSALASYILSFEEKHDMKLEAILAPLLLLDMNGVRLSKSVCEACQSYLMLESLERRKERFGVLLTFANNETEKGLLKKYLTELFYSDLNFFRRIMAPSPQSLFT